VLREGCEADPKMLQDHCKRLMATHKAPKFVQFVDTLPKYQSGKINKQLLISQHVAK